jgi:cyclic-di-GMP-binding protein
MSEFSLHLTVPDATFAALSVCETSPTALADWVAHLPMAHTSEAAHQLLKVATELARIGVDPELRFACLETIRPPAHYICARLDRTAAGASAAGEGHAQLAQSVQKELVLGYKAVLRDALAADTLTDSVKDLLGHAMHRTAADLSCALLRSYEFYTDTPPRAWYELNQIYGLADDIGIATNSYSDEQSRGATMLTIADVYLRIAMLATAKPNQLRQKDLSAVYNALDAWTPRVTIGTPADDTMFVVDLDADAPPSYRELGSHTGSELRGIRTDVLVYELEAYLAEMASDVPVPDYVSPDLLRHLAHAWGVMKKRSFRRSHSSGPMKICIGLRTLHYYISGGVEFADQLEINPFIGDQPAQRSARPGDVWDGAFDLRGARIPVNPNIDDPNRILLNSRRPQLRSAVEATYPCYDTEIVDTSPSGYCVRWSSPLPAQLQTGELLAIREREDARWCIAVSRWIRHSDQETLLGIELLAPKAIPIAVRMLQKRGNNTDYHRAVLLPALEAIGQPAMLITPRLPYTESQKVQLRRHGIQATGQLMRRVRMTESFTQFTFRMLDGYLENTQIDLNMDSLWDMIGADQSEQPAKGSPNGSPNGFPTGSPQGPPQAPQPRSPRGKPGPRGPRRGTK